MTVLLPMQPVELMLLYQLQDVKLRLGTLEAQNEELEISIAQEMIEKPFLTKEQIIFWISKFKDGNITDLKYCKSIIDLSQN